MLLQYNLSCAPCRFGSTAWNEDKAAMLRAMLESAVQRRFPLGRKVHVFANNTSCLAELAAAFQNAGLAISRCVARCRLCRKTHPCWQYN